MAANLTRQQTRDMQRAVFTDPELSRLRRAMTSAGAVEDQLAGTPGARGTRAHRDAVHRSEIATMTYAAALVRFEHAWCVEHVAGVVEAPAGQ